MRFEEVHFLEVGDVKARVNRAITEALAMKPPIGRIENVETKWDGDILRFRFVFKALFGFQCAGEVYVNQDRVIVDLRVPDALKKYEGEVERVLRKEFAKRFR